MKLPHSELYPEFFPRPLTLLRLNSSLHPTLLLGLETRLERRMDTMTTMMTWNSWRNAPCHHSLSWSPSVSPDKVRCLIEPCQQLLQQVNFSRPAGWSSTYLWADIRQSKVIAKIKNTEDNDMTEYFNLSLKWRIVNGWCQLFMISPTAIQWMHITSTAIIVDLTNSSYIVHGLFDSS